MKPDFPLLVSLKSEEYVTKIKYLGRHYSESSWQRGFTPLTWLAGIHLGLSVRNLKDFGTNTAMAHLYYCVGAY